MKREPPRIISAHAHQTYQESTIAPRPARESLPQWYRDAYLFHSSNDRRDLQVSNKNGRDTANLSFKHCAPFLDVLTAGYHYVTPIDITVQIVDDSPVVTWEHPVVRPIETRGYVEVPVPSGCWPTHYIWDMRWGFKTPPGYSSLFTHPFNRYDLPFITYSGVQDTDTWWAPNAITFFLRKDFEGLIPSGTPMFSVFPFKRDDWQLTIDHDLAKSAALMLEQKRTKIFGFYKETAWNTKHFR